MFCFLSQNTLRKLKCFSLYVSQPTDVFHTQVMPFLRLMSNLEKLTLSIRVRNRPSFIDGTYLDDHIFTCMSHLHTFNFDIVTQDVIINQQVKPSSDDIRRTFVQRGHQADGYICYDDHNIGRSHVYSLPFHMKQIQFIKHGFPGGMFKNVHVLRMCDFFHSFEHSFFAQISRSFPLLSRLLLANTKEQKEKSSRQLVKPEVVSSIIEYSHLVELRCTWVHIDYVEQFLSNLNTRLPCLSKLFVRYEHLVTVTENFSRNTTRINCAKLKHLHFSDQVPMVHSKDFYLYFPLL
jgi:hypothetical protein